MSAGPALRDASHIEETLRLTAAEPSAEVSGEAQRHHLIDKIWLLHFSCNERAKGALHVHPYTRVYTHTARFFHVFQAFGAETPGTLHWNEKAAECLQRLCQRQRKTDVFACEWKEVWDNFSEAFLLTLLFENCFTMWRSRGCYVWLCLLYMCMCVCVCADTSWSGWLIRAKVLLCPRPESTSVLLNCSGSCQRGAAAEPVS